MSMEFESKYAPSALSANPVTVSACALMRYSVSFLRRSKQRMLLSRPAVKIRSPASENTRDVIGYYLGLG